MRNIIIGIDISAKTLDICIKKDKQYEFIKIDNSPVQIKKFLKPYKPLANQVYLGMENTGKYNNNLYQVLSQEAFTVFVVHPYHLKQSIGLARGKNDKVDAERIVSFVQKNYEELEPWEPSSKSLQNLKVLSTERRAMVKTRTRLKQKKKDYKYISDKSLRKKLERINTKSIKEISAHIREIEKIIDQTIKADESLKTNMDLMQSVPGVGKIVATAILVKTDGFRLYKKPRKLACCAGVVPFNYQSGTSINSRSKVSHMADKSLKTLLNMAALRAVRMGNDLQHYYDRKVAEGKNKMSVLNAVRNKIIHIIYAVIKNQKTFKNRLVLS